MGQKKAALFPIDTNLPAGPFQSISMDLITDLPQSGKYDTVLTIVNQGCSKAMKFLPCTKDITTEGVATLYLQHLVPWFGTLKWVMSRPEHVTLGKVM